jgi:hypothetical protein
LANALDWCFFIRQAVCRFQQTVSPPAKHNTWHRVTLANMTAPCSVNARGKVGENLSRRTWSQFATTSAFSLAVNTNMKSLGKRWRLRFTCSLSRFVVTPYNRARSAMSCCFRVIDAFWLSRGGRIEHFHDAGELIRVVEDPLRRAQAFLPPDTNEITLDRCFSTDYTDYTDLNQERARVFRLILIGVICVICGSIRVFAGA